MTGVNVMWFFIIKPTDLHMNKRTPSIVWHGGICLPVTPVTPYIRCGDTPWPYLDQVWETRLLGQDQGHTVEKFASWTSV